MKKLGLKIVGVIVTVIILLQVNMNVVMGVVTQADIQKEQNKQTQTTNERKETEKELEEVRGEKEQVQKQVQELSSQISNYESQIEQLDQQISDLSTKIKEAEEKIKKSEEDYTQQEELLEKRLVATYEAGETSYLDFLLSSEGITDFISNYYLVTEVATSDTELLEKIQKQKQEIEQAKEELESNKKELDTSKASKQSVATQLQTAKNEKNLQVAKLSKDEQELEKQVQELKDYEASIKERITDMKTQFDKNPPITNSGNNGNSGSGGNSNNDATSSYGFGWPVSNHRIGTGYGVKGSMWSLGYHTGVDFPVSTGTPIYAVGNGQVFDTGYNSSYGYFVLIYHGKNVYSHYAHASSLQVSRGQMVTKGQQIMLSGATGNVSGPHLHFEIRTPGSGFYNCVNPMNYLP